MTNNKPENKPLTRHGKYTQVINFWQINTPVGKTPAYNYTFLNGKSEVCFVNNYQKLDVTPKDQQQICVQGGDFKECVIFY